jgi:hypothetical protein
VRTQRLTNFSEGQALGILEQAFRGTSYVAHPKVRLADVVRPDDDESLVPGDKDYLLRAHLDFVVCDRSRAMMPVFAMEREVEEWAKVNLRPRQSKR